MIYLKNQFTQRVTKTVLTRMFTSELGYSIYVLTQIIYSKKMEEQRPLGFRSHLHLTKKV